MEDHKIIIVREELENDLNWRMDELRLLKNQLLTVDSIEKQNLFRRSLIVMLYSHYEGFCNFAFQLYVLTINEEKLLRKQVKSCLAIASMHQEFSHFESDTYKEDRFRQVFGKKLPNNDLKLLKHSKRIFMYDCFEDVSSQELFIPDKVVNTESNLWPIVLKKLLYTLGLPENHFVKYEASIKKLIDYRNGISHGQRDFRDGIDEATFHEIENSCNEINKNVIKLVYDSLKNDVYLKQQIV